MKKIKPQKFYAVIMKEERRPEEFCYFESANDSGQSQITTSRKEAKSLAEHLSSVYHKIQYRVVEIVPKELT